MQTVTLEIPESIAAGYTSLASLKQAVYEDFVAGEYQKGAISLREGARMLGLTYEAFMIDFLGSRQISVINGSPTTLKLEAQQEIVWLEELSGDK